VVVASVMEFVTRGRLGPVGMVIALLIAVIISWNLPGRQQASAAGSSAEAPSAVHRTSNDPHALLGVAPGCSDEELSRAYHALVRKWHPDQLEGMAEELRQHANQRLAEINQALEQIRNMRKKGRPV
jgi:DnaJ-domain-containing protein 1